MVTIWYRLHFSPHNMSWASFQVNKHKSSPWNPSSSLELDFIDAHSLLLKIPFWWIVRVYLFIIFANRIIPQQTQISHTHIINHKVATPRSVIAWIKEWTHFAHWDRRHKPPSRKAGHHALSKTEVTPVTAPARDTLVWEADLWIPARVTQTRELGRSRVGREESSNPRKTLKVCSLPGATSGTVSHRP